MDNVVVISSESITIGIFSVRLESHAPNAHIILGARLHSLILCLLDPVIHYLLVVGMGRAHTELPVAGVCHIFSNFLGHELPQVVWSKHTFCQYFSAGALLVACALIALELVEDVPDVFLDPPVGLLDLCKDAHVSCSEGKVASKAQQEYFKKALRHLRS